MSQLPGSPAFQQHSQNHNSHLPQGHLGHQQQQGGIATKTVYYDSDLNTAPPAASAAKQKTPVELNAHPPVYHGGHLVVYPDGQHPRQYTGEVLVNGVTHGAASMHTGSAIWPMVSRRASARPIRYVLTGPGTNPEGDPGASRHQFREAEFFTWAS